MPTVYAIAASGSFAEDFEKLDRSVRERIDKKIRWAAAHPEVAGKPLRHVPQDLTGLRKLRVGDYRVLFPVDHAKSTLTVYSVGHRSTVYENL